MRADLFGGHQIHREEGGRREREKVASTEAGVALQIAPENDEGAGDGQGEAEPEGQTGPLAEDQPGKQADDDGGVVAEQRGVGRGSLQDGGVVKSEIEGEEKSAERDDEKGARADARLPAIEKNRGQEDHGGNKQAVKGGRGTGDAGPTNEDGGPGDADDSGRERKVGKRFAGTVRGHQLLDLYVELLRKGLVEYRTRGAANGARRDEAVFRRSLALPEDLEAGSRGNFQNGIEGKKHPTFPLFLQRCENKRVVVQGSAYVVKTGDL